MALLFQLGQATDGFKQLAEGLAFQRSALAAFSGPAPAGTDQEQHPIADRLAALHQFQSQMSH